MKKPKKPKETEAQRAARRRALFDAAHKHDAPEAAYAMLYQQDTYGSRLPYGYDGPSQEEWAAIAAVDCPLFWGVLRETALHGTHNESAVAAAAAMAVADLDAFYETVKCWGSRLTRDAVFDLYSAKAQARPTGDTPSFAGHGLFLADRTAQRLDRDLRAQSWHARNNGDPLPAPPPVVALPEGALTDAGGDDWTFEPVESFQALADDYARYCYGYNGTPSFGKGKTVQAIQSAKYVHIVRCHYRGTALFWVILDATYQRLFWFERVVTKETRKLKRSLGGHIGQVRQVTRQLGEFAFDD